VRSFGELATGGQMLAIATQAYDLKYFLRIWLLRYGKVVQAGRGFFGVKKKRVGVDTNRFRLATSIAFSV
jgi:hypothetical protein